jgi:hypothetical protein
MPEQEDKMDMTEEQPEKRPLENVLAPEWLRGVARVIGFVVSILSLVFIFTGLLGGGLDGIGALMAALAGMALVSCLLSYRRPRLAGIFLVLISIALGIHIGLYGVDKKLLAWVITGLPYLAAGGLMLWAWWMEIKRPASPISPESNERGDSDKV